MKNKLKAWLLDRRVMVVVLVLGIACECYLATLGLWWMRPIALFLAFAMVHLLTISMWTWRELDRARQSQAFFTQVVKPMMDRVLEQEVESDDEASKPTNVN
jgi:hypothetical protein